MQLVRRQNQQAMSEPAASTGQQPERAVLDRIATGDRDALAHFYSTYQRPLFRYLCTLTPDQGLAEEILQDTLVAVWRSAGAFEGRSAVRTWVFGIARRQAHNALGAAGWRLSMATPSSTCRTRHPNPKSGRWLGLNRPNWQRRWRSSRRSIEKW